MKKSNISGTLLSAVVRNNELTTVMPLALTVNQRYALAVPTDPDSIARNERGTGTTDDLLRSLVVQSG